MDSINYENQILNAIETIVNNTVENAGYDKTIKARILERTNPDIGEYKVRYQDSTFYAYSADVEIKYMKDTMVYILVPNNDMSQIKTIISAVDKDNVEYIEVLDTEDYYDKNGGNALTLRNQSQVFSVCSYKENDIYEIYNKDAEESDIIFDNEWFASKLKNLYNIIGGAYFKTTLSAEQQKQGNYGLVFEIEMEDEINPSIHHIKNFVLSTDQMEGNPYYYTNYNRQDKVYDIDSEHFVSVNRIYLFSQGFPNISDSEPDDIFVMTPFLYAAREIPEAERNGFTLKLETDKDYFMQEDPITSTVINSSIKIRGKEPHDEHNFQYYWFKENLDIYPTMPGYNTYGGSGWECLNEYNVLEEDENHNPIQIEYITNKSTLTVNKDDCIMLNNKFKLVVVISEESSIEAEITIQNFDAAFDFCITSDSGFDFYYGNGTPTLTATVLQRGETPLPSNIIYKWFKIDNNGLYTELTETSELNTQYNIIWNKYMELLTALEEGTAMPAAAASYLASYEAQLAAFNTQQRVEGNTIYKIQVNEAIDDYADYKCAYYRPGTEPNDPAVLIGIASERLTNHAIIEGEYFLNILNGDKTYSYSADGTAPNSKKLEEGVAIKPLTFEIIDGEGHALPERVLNHCDIQWTVPYEDTLLVIDPEQSTTGLTINYDIEQLYDIDKLYNNTISLNVKYQDLNLYAETAFAFVKDGDPGTNGTDIICKIVPNIAEGENTSDIISYPMMIYDNSGIFHGFNFTPAAASQYFKVELWQNGKVIWSGVNRQSTKGVTSLRWSNVKTTQRDKTHLTILSTAGICTPVQNENEVNLDINQSWADIIKVEVTYNNINYYATLPLIVAHVHGTTHESSTEFIPNMKLELEKNTGFNYVMYDSNGKTPSYANIYPFTLKTFQVIKSVIDEQDIYEWEDITNNEHYPVTYNWQVEGSYFDSQRESGHYIWHLKEMLREENPIEEDGYTDDNGNFHEDPNYQPIPINYNHNWHYYIPIDEFNGEVINTAIVVTATDSLYNCSIRIPIHYYLNRYGLTAINDWDGNSIEINNEDGIILSPRVGAGHKEQDNSFTGVLMGSVREGTKQEIEDGLFGYYQGQRSIFLDAKTGKAEFGVIGKSRITLDPTENTAKLYSGNYSESYLVDPEPNETYTATDAYYGQRGYQSAESRRLILGKDYQVGEIISAGDKKKIFGEGMLIDLTTPEIKFGSGNFSVDEHGYLVALEGGSIAGWQITENVLYKDAGAELDSSGFSIHQYRTNLSSSIGTGSGEKRVFWVEDLISEDCPFYILNNGVFFAQGMTIEGGILDDNQFVKGSLQVGPYYSEYGFLQGYNFIVDHHGTLKINNQPTFNPEYREGVTPESEKWIPGGGADLKNVIIKNNKNSLNEIFVSHDDGIYFGLDGFSAGSGTTFQVTDTGELTSTKGTIAGWTIEENFLHSGQDSTLTSDYVGISSNRIQTIALWAGDSDSSNAPFKVSRAGKLFTYNPEFTGTITLNAATITKQDGSSTKTYTFSSSESRINEIPRIYSGSNVPSNDIGQDGDIYIRY